MATLPIQSIGNLGMVPNYPAATSTGDKVVTGSGAYIEVVNGDATSTNVTLVTPQLIDGDLTVQDRVIAVANGTRQKIAVPDLYRNPADGLASITYSKVTSLTIGSFRAPV